MKTKHIWRNCYLKAINFPEAWKNMDVFLLTDKRQDLFMVECNIAETNEQLIPKIKDDRHVKSIIEHTHNCFFLNFFISRDAKYIQMYPFFNLNTHGSAWENIAETTFLEIEQLKLMSKT